MSFIESISIPNSLSAPAPDLIRDFGFAEGFRQMPPAQPAFIQLDFENLKGFEQLSDQYASSGVRFEGAIALQPSNPAFVPPSASQVLMPLVNQTGITAYFPRPASRAGAFVIGTKPVVLAAFDADGNRLREINTDANYVISPAGELPKPLPHHRLEVTGTPIAKVVFYSNAPFILDDFFFSH
ncbi:MAG: hypothetical protein KME26_21270 [Oscillatoria princeps RMCB-10]|nr:hypothetical protein [Oscillatoria princeps RMCB-10]